MEDEIFTVKEIAEKLKMSEFVVRQYCKRGIIEAFKIQDKEYRITLEGFKEFIATEKEIQKAMIKLEENAEYCNAGKDVRLAMRAAERSNVRLQRRIELMQEGLEALRETEKYIAAEESVRQAMECKLRKKWFPKNVSPAIPTDKNGVPMPFANTVYDHEGNIIEVDGKKRKQKLGN